METNEKLKGKFVVAFDTIVDGEQTVITEENMPRLFDSEDSAFFEIFDDAVSMLSGRSDEELAEYNEDVTPAMVTEMKALLNTGDIPAMRKFLTENPQCNDNNEFVLPAETFILGRKVIYTGE